MGAHGTWQQTGGGGDGVLAAVGAVVAGALVLGALMPVASAVGSALGELLRIVIVTAGCVLIAAALGGAGLLLWRRRHPRPVRPPPWKAEVTGAMPSRPAPPLAPPARRELPAPTVVHNHWHLPEGMDPDALAQALVRAQAQADGRTP